MHETHKNIEVVAGVGWLATFALVVYAALSHYHHPTARDDNPNLPAHTAAAPANNAYHQKEEKTLVPDLGVPANIAGYAPLPEVPAPPAYDPMGKSDEQVMDDVREYVATQSDLGRTLRLGPGCEKGLEQIRKIYDRMNGTAEGLPRFMAAMGDRELCESLGENNKIKLDL